MTNKQALKEIWKFTKIMFAWRSISWKIQALEQMQNELLERLDK